MLRVLEHILMTWPALQPENRAYNDSIKDLQAESMVELQRLAAKMPDHLLVSCRSVSRCTLFANGYLRMSTPISRPRSRR